MRRIVNIKSDRNKVAQIKLTKELICTGVKDALDRVNRILGDGYVNLLPLDSKDDYLKIFGGEYETDETDNSDDDMYAPRKQDPDTALAYDWLEGLSGEEKRKIALIISWERFGMIPVG